MKRLLIALALIVHIGCSECDDSREIQRLRQDLAVLKEDATDLYATLEAMELDDEDPSDRLTLEDELMMNAIQQAAIEIEIEQITKESDCL